MNAIPQFILLVAAGAWSFSPALAQEHGDRDHHDSGDAVNREHGHGAPARLPNCPVMGDPIDFTVKFDDSRRADLLLLQDVHRLAHWFH